MIGHGIAVDRVCVPLALRDDVSRLETGACYVVVTALTGNNTPVALIEDTTIPELVYPGPYVRAGDEIRYYGVRDFRPRRRQARILRDRVALGPCG